MNIWMSDPFPYPEQPMDRGKVLDAATLARLGEWGRYKDVDGDGIPWRTLPGTDMPAYFTRGSGHNEKGQYSERGDDYAAQHGSAVAEVRHGQDAGAQAGCRSRRGRAHRLHRLRHRRHWAIVEGRDQLRARGRPRHVVSAPEGVPVHRRSWLAFIDQHDRVYVVEQNRDAQMLALMRMDSTRRARQAAQRAALQRPAHRRAQHQRRGAGTGGPGRGARRHGAADAPHAAGVGGE